MPSLADRLQLPTAALFWGLQFSFLSPSLGILLAGLFGASATQIGTVLMVYNLAGLACSLVIPTMADRHGDYLRPLGTCALLTGSLAVALALSGSLRVAVVALVLLGAPASVGGTLFFAHLRASGTGTRRMMDIRAIMSFAWVFGMPLATFVLGRFGPRGLLVSLALVAVMNIVNTLGLRRSHAAALARAEAAGRSRPRLVTVPASRRLLAVMVLVFVLLQATNVAAVTVTSLLVTERLELRVFWAGTALGLSALLEIPALMAVGRLAERYGNSALLFSGCLAAVGYYAAMSQAHLPWQLLVLQVLNAWAVAVVSGVGLTWFQESIARPGLASAVFGNTRLVGAIVSGPLVAFGAATSLGYAGVFAAAAVVCAVVSAVVLLLWLVRSRRAGARRAQSAAV
ncbi:MFS transporter [Luteococcus peritonei]|uniref:MFS transporter n=1 Tax=Luteococcus peritonei TaxID=88874 RepID=A0ABW4RUM7_9ACTN